MKLSTLSTGPRLLHKKFEWYDSAMGRLHNSYERVSLFILQTIPLKKLVAFVLVALFLVGSGAYVYAASTSNFQQTITAGTLSVDITDASYVTVGSPSVALGSTAFSFACQTTTGTFGTSTQQIYIQNPDAADNGFTVSLAASATTDVWDSAGTDFDFNDPTSSGCADGADADSVGGQMTVDASGATLSEGQCASCTTTNVTLGSSTAFNEGTTDSITLVTAASGADDVGDWYVRDIDISQSIPAEQPAAADYDINMTLSIVAS